MKIFAPLLIVFLVLAQAAAASDLAQFSQAVAAAYHPYKSGVFYLRTDNPSVAGFEIAEAAEVWRRDVMPFAAAPPDAFSDDPDFAADLAEIAERLTNAAAQIGEEREEDAAAQLNPVREILGRLRARNGQIAFSDYVDAANEAMDRLWEFRDDPPDWSDVEAVDLLKAQTAVTAYLYRRCRDAAAPELAQDPEFLRITEGAIASFEGLWREIRAQDTAAVINYLRELRSFDRILWLQFG